MRRLRGDLIQVKNDERSEQSRLLEAIPAGRTLRIREQIKGRRVN